MPTELAYVEPESTSRGKMTFIPGGESTHTYRRSDPVQEIETGFYEVDYDISRGEKGVHVYDIYWLNDATPATPVSAEVLFALVREVTGYDDRIIPRFTAEEDVVDILRRLTSRSWLEEIKGIGSARSKQLVRKFETFSPKEIEVYSAFQQHGLPYNRGNAREQWARTFFAEFEDELETFRANPYHLLLITDYSRKRVRHIEQMAPDTNIVDYHLAWVDDHVMEHDLGRWQYSKERAIAFLRRAAQDVFDQGHTIARCEQVAAKMRRRGFDRLEVTGDNGHSDTVRVTGALVEDLIAETNRLEFLVYTDPRTGDRMKGVTTPQLQMRAMIIRKQMKWLDSKDTPFSDQAAHKMRRAALDTVPFELDDKQEQAVKHAFHGCISAITGPAGAGKTTVLQSVLNGMARLMREHTTYTPLRDTKTRTRTAFSVYVTAPTGKATQRIREGLEVINPNTGRPIDIQPIGHENMPEGRHLRRGELQVGTLHSFLGFRGHSWDVPAPHPSVVVVDESSMMDQEAMFYLCRYIRRCMEDDIPVMLLMTGDVAQLEPVGSGYPFRDVLGETVGTVIPSTELDTIHRQGQSSAIIEASHDILDGNVPLVSEDVLADDNLADDFYWHDYPNTPRGQPIDLWTYLSAVAGRATTYTDGPEVTPEDVQLILPLRNPSSIDPAAPHTRAANEELQNIFAQERNVPIEAFTAAPLGDPDDHYTTWIALGDRVVHSGRNAYTAEAEDAPAHEPVMRGAVGRVVEADLERGVRVDYPFMETVVTYHSPQEIGQLELAYALTGHTSQGSEFDVVAICLPQDAGPTLMTRSWLYTALTRASRFLDLMATQKRVRLCATTDSGGARQTILSSHVQL